VAVIFGISATQLPQLVAQKLTKVTRPLKSALLRLEPSSNTNTLFGALVFRIPSPDQSTAAVSATPAKASASK
jgi:hypothetical protein